MKASDIMTMPVATVSIATSVRHAARIMLDRGVSGLPVLDDEGRLTGIVTEGDLLRRAELGTVRATESNLPAEQRARAYVKSHGWSVEDVMTKELVTITEDTPVGRVAAVMEERGVKRLPVIRDGRL
ncbi:MAG: CBS domain-containing protein, partial [Pseudaminobacter sp.]